MIGQLYNLMMNMTMLHIPIYVNTIGFMNIMYTNVLHAKGIHQL